MIIESRVAGVSFYQSAVEKVERGDIAILIPEPENVHDGNAIRVEVRGEKVGYIPKGWNTDLLECIDTGYQIEAEVRSVGRPNSKAPIGMIIGIIIQFKGKPNALEKRLE